MSNKNFNRFLEKVGDKIREERKRKGLTQSDFEDLRIPWRYFQEVEAGRNITLWTLYRVAKKLNVHPKDLLNFEHAFEKS